MLPSPQKDLFIQKVLALGLYRVGEDGVITSHVRTKVRIVKQSEMNDGYARVGLSFESTVHYVKAHRVVAIARVVNPDPAGRIFVNHKDGLKLRNHPLNLEWVTTLENSEHAWATGLSIGIGGDLCPSSKVTEEEVAKIRELCATTTLTQKEIGAMFGIAQNTVSVIASGKNWRPHAA